MKAATWITFNFQKYTHRLLTEQNHSPNKSESFTWIKQNRKSRTLLWVTDHSEETSHILRVYSGQVSWKRWTKYHTVE